MRIDHSHSTMLFIMRIIKNWIFSKIWSFCKILRRYPKSTWVVKTQIKWNNKILESQKLHFWAKLATYRRRTFSVFSVLYEYVGAMFAVFIVSFAGSSQCLFFHFWNGEKIGCLRRRSKAPKSLAPAAGIWLKNISESIFAMLRQYTS